jgi:hypothetical protein
MKKPIVIAAAIALAAIAGWSALWFAGRGAVADRLDREIARLQALGFDITYDAREIGGFPFGYRVTHRGVALREPASGATYRLPEVTTEVTAADIDRLVTRFPAKYRIDLPLDEAQRAGWPGMPEVLAIDVDSSDLVVVSNGVPGEGQEIAITARSVLIVTGSAEQPLNVAIELTALDAGMTLPAISSAGSNDLPRTSRTTFGRIDYAYTSTTPDGVAAQLEGSIDNLRLTGTSNIRDRAGFLALLAGSESISSVTYQTSASQAAIRLADGPQQQGKVFNFSTGSTAGTFSLANGIFEITSVSQANRVTVSATTAPATPPGESLSAELRAVEMRMTGPFAPGETMAPFALRFALDQLAPDDAIWSQIDAAGALPRDPAQLVIDIEGSARIIGDLTKNRPGEAPPVEIGNLSIRSADIAALGASLTTRGDVEFLQPLNLPVGTVTVTLTKVEALVVKLVDAGLIDPVTAQTVMLMATGFVAPGSEPGELVSEIVMTLDGITVNGKPVGGD